MTARLGVGVVGCGRIAQLFHLPILREHPGVDLVGVADADPGARAAAMRTAPGTVGVAALEQLLALPDLDAVVVCLPTDRHADAAVSAFEAGAHVYVEKPLATTLDDADRIRAAWRASGRVGLVGFNFRFHPLVAAAREVVRSGRLGTVVAVRTLFTSAPRALPDWKRARRTGGGALLDLASHHVDLVRFLLDDEVAEVGAAIRSAVSLDDTAAVTLQLSSGVLAQMTVSVSAAQSDRVEILGDTATLTVDRMASRHLRVVPAANPTTARERFGAAATAVGDGLLWTVDRLRPPPEPSFAASLGAFVTAAGGGPPAGATIDDGHRSLAVVEAAERAAAKGERVLLSAADRLGRGAG